MAWREGLRFAGPEARRIHDAAFPHAPLAPGKEIRITFEEEVSECCEKWRGRLTYNYEPGAPGAWTTNDPPTFCPECGRKL